MPIKTNINRKLLIISALIFTITRLIGDIALFYFSDYQSFYVFGWKTVSFLAFFITVFLFEFSRPHDEHQILNDRNSENFFRDLKKVLLIVPGIILLQIFVPSRPFVSEQFISLWGIIIADIATFYVIHASIITGRFLYKWMTIRRHSRTKLYLKILVSGTLLISLFMYLDFAVGTKDSKALNIFITLLILILITFVFLLSKKNNWILLLPGGKKLKLLGLTVLGMGIMFFSSLFIVEDYTLGRSVNIFMPGLPELSGITLIFASIYFLRLFFATIASLPTSNIMEKRLSELSSLTYLNKLVSQTVDFNNLIGTVTQLAQGAVQGTASWTELYEANTSNTIIFSSYLDDTNAGDLLRNPLISQRFSEIKEPLIIESIPEDEELSKILKPLKLTGSMIVVPLFAGNNRIGTLFVVNSEEFGFEPDDVNVIAAFSDNVSLALENARLLKDSIEKEHFKQELLLAKNMQQKLLPQELPNFKKYTIDAFSMPAEEVGGDFYDLGLLKDGRPCILIGDVSGKGMNAAFYMAQLKGVVLSVARDAESPAELLKKINSTLYKSMERQMFITMAALSVDIETGIITYARAGHTPLIIKRNGSSKLYRPQGLGIGLADSEKFNSLIEEEIIPIESNDVCMMFTDGLDELENSRREQLGIDPVLELFNKGVYNNATDALRDVKKLIDNYAGGYRQSDDITAIAVCFN